MNLVGALVWAFAMLVLGLLFSFLNLSGLNFLLAPVAVALGYLVATSFALPLRAVAWVVAMMVLGWVLPSFFHLGGEFLGAMVIVGGFVAALWVEALGAHARVAANKQLHAGYWVMTMVVLGAVLTGFLHLNSGLVGDAAGAVVVAFSYYLSTWLQQELS